MKRNAVEALSIINPGDKNLFGLENRDYKMLAIGAAVAICGSWLISKLRGRGQVPVQQQGGDSSGLLILAVLGAVGWYVWSNYNEVSETKPEQESEEYPSRNPRKKTHRRYARSSGSGGGYFVRVVGTNEVYPKPGSKDYPRGYSLRSAQNFARIGSQTGAARKVLRGSKNGPVVRKYENGERVWPTTAAQARSLKPAERPREFRKSA